MAQWLRSGHCWAARGAAIYGVHLDIALRSGQYQARLLGVKVDGKACQRPIPRLFKDIPGVMAAQAASMLLFQSGGVEAVWPTKEIAPAERNKCSEVRRPAACSCTLSFART